LTIQFERTQLHCLRTVVKGVRTQEQTQEIRIQDDMPDIGTILACWGFPIVRGKEWRSGSMSVSGGIMVWVLYEPEDGSHPQTVEGWLPFQLKWDFEDSLQDGVVTAFPLLKSVDARSMSARKLMVRGVVSVLGEGMVSENTDIVGTAQLPEDIQILKNIYPTYVPVEAGEKFFNLEETISLPGGAPAVEEIVRYDLRPEILERKLVSDKVVFRGICVLHLLYRSTDGMFCSSNLDLPFSQYSQLEAEYDTNSMIQVIPVVTGMELEENEEGLRIKAGITVQYVICDKKLIEITEDAYSTKRSVDISMLDCELPGVLEMRSETMPITQTIQADAVRVVDVACYPEHPGIYREEERIFVDPSGTTQLLFYNTDGNLQCEILRWDEEWSLPVSSSADIDVQMQITGNPQDSLRNGEIVIKTDLLMNTVTKTEKGKNMICEVDLGECTEPDPNRPSLILRRAGNDSLWQIAKETGSSVELIQKANELQTEPENDRILLIPVI